MVVVRLNIRIRNLLFLSILNQEIGFFDSIGTGKLMCHFDRLNADARLNSLSLLRLRVSRDSSPYIIRVIIGSCHILLSTRNTWAS